MPITTLVCQKNQPRRQRLRAAGIEEVLVRAAARDAGMIDELKERQGLRNRSQALLQLIEQREGNRPADDLKMRKPALPGGL